MEQTKRKKMGKSLLDETANKVRIETLQKRNAKLENMIKALYEHFCNISEDATILNQQFKEYIYLKEKETAILKKRLDCEYKINFINGIIRGKSCLSEEINRILNPTDNLPF